MVCGLRWIVGFGFLDILEHFESGVETVAVFHAHVRPVRCEEREIHDRPGEFDGELLVHRSQREWRAERGDFYVARFPVVLNRMPLKMLADGHGVPGAVHAEAVLAINRKFARGTGPVFPPHERLARNAPRPFPGADFMARQIVWSPGFCRSRAKKSAPGN